MAALCLATCGSLSLRYTSSVISEEVICISLVLGILNYILLAIVITQMIRRCTKPNAAATLDDDTENRKNAETADFRRAA